MRRARQGTSRGGRTGVLPVLAGVVSALALTGAAVYTVEQADCGPGQYVRHDDHVELVGGCVGGADLPTVDPGQVHREKSTGDTNYRP